MKKINYILTVFLIGGVLSFASMESARAQEPSNSSAQTNDDDDDDGFDFGWVGLIGLAGLLGLKKRDHVDTSYTRPTTPRV